MFKKFIRFSKIGQFRNIIHDVKHVAQFTGEIGEDGNPIMDRNAKLPVITFNGTVKLHGTNAGVAFNSDGEMWVQSRQNIITPEHDNAGFAFFATTHKEAFEEINDTLRMENDLTNKTIVIFGEWCGGNIQKGVAISGLEKMFVIFAIKVVDEFTEEVPSYYLETDKWKHLFNLGSDYNIYNINNYDSFSIEVDFNDPSVAQNKMVELVEQVEKECPVGKAFGRKLDTEDDTTGEGIVWVGWYEGNRYVFKTKGDKHSTSKVKVIAPIDTEKLNSVNEFVEYAVTENRLNQGIEQVFTISGETPEVSKTGNFLKWIVNDVISEELDTLVDNGLEPKDVTKAISGVARKWYFDKLDEISGL